METLTTGFVDNLQAATTREQLDKLAGSLNVTIDKRLSLENAKEALIKHFEATANETKIQNEKSSSVITKATKEETVDFEFRVLDCVPDNGVYVLEFVYVPEGVKLSANAKIPMWSFVHGETYRGIPKSVVRHLQSLKTPTSRVGLDGKSVISQTPRFMAQPIV
jgi:hypothetical protein